jgi:peptidyl-prolyl cis-trans isomerase B (cyclophilin B)
MSKVVLVTSQGRVTLSLDDAKAPKTAANFLEYARSGFFDGTIFHRVIPGFVVQGGGMLPGMKPKRGNAPIRNEADNGLKNRRGTIAMARTGDPHSASSQFFINLRDNTALDFKSTNTTGWGYCVFGEVTEGMDVVDAIAKAKTGSSGMHQDVPLADIILERAEVADSGG